MEIWTFVNIFVHLCALWISLVDLKPVPDFEDYPEGCVHSEKASNLMRARRSIPDSDAANPAYLETGDESQPIQEELSNSGKDNDISPFALSDPMSEFFRIHKDRDAQKTPVKQGSGDRPANWAKDDELVRREALTADEQIECYKQQNIEPPGNSDEPQVPLLRLKDQRPFANAFQNNQRIMSRPLMYKERGSQKIHDRLEEANEITSLYSDPEKRQKTKKQKSNTRLKNAEHALDQLSERSVYKPVGVRAEFPVYDEDIDFHPDPLQGILEDKYWLDPQEQEAVIRKYIDLANNMQPPPSVDYSKRDEPRREFVPKSVDSKDAFRDAEAVDRECPCRDIAACGDCSKGKWRKNNSSENGALIYGSYGNRKLLSINYDAVLNEDRGGDTGNEIKDMYVESDNTGYIFQGKEDKFEKDPLNDHGSVVDLGEKNEDETQVEGEVPSFTSNYFGRKLLSFEDDETTKEYYGEDEDTENTEYDTSEDFHSQKGSLSTFKSGSSDEYENEAGKSENRRSIPYDGDLNIRIETKNENNDSSPILKPLNNSVYEYKLETEKIGNAQKDLKLNSAEEFAQMQKPFLVKPHDFAKYYVPNKFGNLFQKTLIRQRPMESSSTIDPDLEFAIERNQTFLNVSIAMNDINISDTTEMAEFVENNKVRREQPSFLKVKGRRSYQIPLMKHPLKTLQGADDLGSANVQDGNNTVNASSSTNVTLPAATSTNDTAINATDLSSNKTDTTANTTAETATTENSTLNVSTTLKPKKKMEDYDEDSFDAEIANDIVETVIAESQSGSVVGHNLGLCRRNDSVSKYAKVSPESEQLLKKVTECILDRIRDRLEGQSCTLLDDELLQFLKWMVLSGESYKDYLARIKPEFREFKSHVQDDIGPELPTVDVKTQVPVTAKQTS